MENIDFKLMKVREEYDKHIEFHIKRKLPQLYYAALIQGDNVLASIVEGCENVPFDQFGTVVEKLYAAGYSWELQRPELKSEMGPGGNLVFNADFREVKITIRKIVLEI